MRRERRKEKGERIGWREEKGTSIEEREEKGER